MAAISPPLSALPTAPTQYPPLRWKLRRALARILPRPLTKAERDEIAAEKKAHELDRQNFADLKREASHYAREISETLISLNICYRYKVKESDWMTGGVQALKFERPYRVCNEGIWLKADLSYGRRPRGIGIKELADEETLKNLSVACGHTVKAIYTPEGGFWYLIEREYGVGGIPSHVKFDDITSRRPASADGLSLALGIGEGKRTYYRSLGQMYSMGVFGTVGGGKSNILNEILCTLIRHNSPNRLKLVLVDLKGGVEFNFYAGVPHLLQLPTDEKDFEGKSIYKPMIVEKREQVPDAFSWLINEGERRMVLLKDTKSKSIGQYNYKNRNKALPHIVCVIDEWSDVKLDKKIGGDSEEMLINIASRFRAVGIHVILCTQVPNKDVVSIRVKGVLPAKLVFSVPDQYASMLILGNTDALGLSPAGRAIFDWAGRRVQIQTPFINNDTVESIIAQAIAGKFNTIESSTHDVTDEEIFEWALNDNGGDLDYRKIHTQYRIRGMTEPQVRAFCESYENEIVVVGSATYKVMPGGPGRARKLLAQADEAETVTVS